MAKSRMRMFRVGTVAAALLAGTILAWDPAAGAQMGDAGQGAGPAVAMGAGRGLQGTVTAVAADHLTMKTEKGDTYQVAVTANTRVMKGREAMKLADVHAGDGVGTMGEIDPATKTVHALLVMVVSAEQLKAAREAMGKTFISGTVTAINETKLTILRTDQVSQVIEVDEDTSFRKGGRGMQMAMGGSGTGYAGGGVAGAGGRNGAASPDSGESVTLADIKVGYVVAGPGKLKNGVFVPTQLGISDPATQRQRRRSQQDGSAATPAPPAEPK